jgi:transcriptional regulator GlxA family with amidase domain
LIRAGVLIQEHVMGSHVVLWSGVGVVGLCAVAAGAWMLSLPPKPAYVAPPPVPTEEAAAILDALKPSKRQRPLIAVVGLNDATEATDYLMPYGILRRSGVVDVMLLATEPGPVQLFPALRVEPAATIAAFDVAYPDGADYVIVPAMSRDDDPAVLAWLKTQADKGAMIVGVCAGAKVVAAAGLLDGRRGTTHWYYLKELRRKHPTLRYVPDRRIVVDGRVATTTGISASMPVALTLIEAIAGRATAEAVGRDIGMTDWDARHDSSAFTFNRTFAWTAIRNTAAIWNREQFGIALTPGLDEVSLALVADAWSRTYRSRALTFAPTGEPVETLSGVRVVPDRVMAGWPADTQVQSIGNRVPARALDDVLAAIAARYGAPTSDFVAMQLEYPAHAIPE